MNHIWFLLLLELSAAHFTAPKNTAKIWVILWFKNELYQNICFNAVDLLQCVSVRFQRSTDVRV